MGEISKGQAEVHDHKGLLGTLVKYLRVRLKFMTTRGFWAHG